MVEATKRIGRAPTTRNPHSKVDRVIAQYGAALAQWLDAVRARQLGLEEERLACRLGRANVIKGDDVRALATNPRGAASPLQAGPWSCRLYLSSLQA
jgi:hypothetical protein